MSWRYNRINLISDPCAGRMSVTGSAAYEFNFPYFQQPIPVLLPDTMRVVPSTMADFSRRSYRLGPPFRNVQLNVAYLGRHDLMKFRMFTRHNHQLALFANYSADTCLLLHFEEPRTASLTTTPPEWNQWLSADPTYGADPTAHNAPYESGPCGEAITIEAGRYLRMIRGGASILLCGSISFWLKIGANGTFVDRGIWACKNASPEQFELGYDTTVADVVLRWSDGSDYLALGNPTIAAGEWHQIGFSWDFTATTVRLYWDGVRVDETADATSLPTTLSELMLLGNSDTYGDYSDGAFDEFRYDGTLQDDTFFAAQFERFDNSNVLWLQEQVQGQYFEIASDTFGPLSTVDAALYSGAVILQGAWADENHRCQNPSID